MTSEISPKNGSEIEFVIKTPSYCHEKEVRINVPIPLPEYTYLEDWMGKLRSQPSGKFLDYEEAKESLRKFIYNETVKYENQKVKLALKKHSELGLPVFYQLPKKPDARRKTAVPFEEKFTFVVEQSSSENLLTLMRMEVFMKKQMTDMIRARNWEVDQLSKQCEKLVAETGDSDMHPHKISLLNEKLRQVHTTYSFQVADLSDSQKAKYRKAVDSLYTRGSIPAEFLDDVVLDDHAIPRPVENVASADGVNESFTIYIGSQLKSMHNMCLVTVDRLTDLCQTLEGDWTTSSRLEMATKLYSRNLSATTLLVQKDPIMHVSSSSDFFKICEQSTELHFDNLGEQLKKVAKSNRERNAWRADRIDEETAKLISEGKTPPEQPAIASALRQDSTCTVGDVYITKHSNLHKVQIVYHLVVDEALQSAEINSRHPCLAGVRNIIRTAARYNTNTIHIPLLLIDRPEEVKHNNCVVSQESRDAVQMRQRSQSPLPDERAEPNEYLVSRGKKNRDADYLLFSADALLHISHDAKVSEKYTWLGERLRLTFKMMRSDSRLIRTMCHSHGLMQCSSKNPSVNFIWMGAPVKSVKMRELMPWQRLNQFPRSTELTKKDRLYENIERSKSIFGAAFDFIPEFYITPRENKTMSIAFDRVAQEAAASGGQLCFPGEFIVKPTNSRQGKGIFFANSMADIPAEGPLLVSRYLKDPYLVNNHKFDLRIYVAVTSFFPLVAYIYSEGLARLASMPYDSSASSDSNEFVHLTNYSINKFSTSFVRNESMTAEDLGHKWTLGALLRYMENEGKDAKLLMLRIEDLIVKSLLSVQNSVATASRTYLRFAGTNYELFGFDVLVDQNLKPWLLEVNLSPSLACDAPLDSLLKTRLVADLLNLACIPLLDRKIIDSVTPALRKSMNQREEEPETSETEELEMDPKCAKTLKRRPVGLKRSVYNKKLASGTTSLIPNAEKKFDQIVRKVELEEERRGDFIRVFPRSDTWAMYSPVMEDLGNDDFDERLSTEIVAKKSSSSSSSSTSTTRGSSRNTSPSSSLDPDELSDLFHEVMLNSEKFPSLAEVPAEIREILAPWYEDAAEYTKKITQEGETYAAKLPVIRATARLRTKSCAESYEVKKVQMAKKKEEAAAAAAAAASAVAVAVKENVPTATGQRV
uniref:Tubulin--tyrosine ligase-like protein 5 n=1 Tax=Caenorhabditis japonica TaxID=281687 RepID=A0A8R1HUV5_CAEJA